MRRYLNIIIANCRGRIVNKTQRGRRAGTTNITYVGTPMRKQKINRFRILVSDVNDD